MARCCFDWAGLLALTLATFCASAATPKRILIVHSFGGSAPPFTTATTAFETALTKEMGEPIDLDEVSLEMARYATLDMEEALVELMGKRQTRWQPDLVVPSGSPAGVFIARYRDRLFPATTPIIYTGMDQRRLPAGALQHNATFVGESYDLPGAVEDILQVAPDTTNVVIIIGATPLEHLWADVIRREYAVFTNRLSFTWFNDLSFEQILARSATLPPRSFMLLILFMKDAAGVTHNSNDAIRRIHQVANAPINGLFKEQLGQGIVGGRLHSDEVEAREAARIAVRILHGERASNFPPKIVGPLSPRFDWRELQRWNIGENRLPRDSTILFREPTIWQKYRRWIISGVAVCVVQALFIVALLANLRKRRRAERSLVEAEARFRIAADAAPLMIWMSGVDKKCTFTNKPWLEFTGRTPEQTLGNGWTEGVHSDDLQRSLRTYNEAFDARQPFVMEYRLRRHNGEYRWISDTGRPRHNIRGDFAGYIGSCVDITERKRADEKFRLAVEASPSVIIMVNQQGQVVLVNSLTERTFGYARAELLGQPFQMLWPERFRVQEPGYEGQLFASSGVRAIAGGRELFARRKDGTEFPIEIGLNPIQVEEGVFVLAAITDISERRRTELEAQQHRQELAHFSRLSIMGELSASMAHELSQPLTAILTNAQAAQRFLAAGQPDPGEFREILQDIAQNTTRARDVIQHVRALVKKDEQDFSDLDVDEAIRRVVTFLRGDIAARNARVELELTPDLPPVHGDPIQIQQVLINLILNSFDAMDGLSFPKRCATISTKPEPAGRVRVTVRDCGTGIPPDKLELIFQPFYTTKSKGMGMGLSVTRSIVELHGGRIWAENHDAGGAAFHVTLPVANGG